MLRRSEVPSGEFGKVDSHLLFVRTDSEKQPLCRGARRRQRIGRATAARRVISGYTRIRPLASARATNNGNMETQLSNQRRRPGPKQPPVFAAFHRATCAYVYTRARVVYRALRILEANVYVASRRRGRRERRGGGRLFCIRVSMYR